MINVTMRVRCISVEAMQAILGLLREESNAIWIETFKTTELPNPDVRATLTYANKVAHGSGLRTNTGPRHSPARRPPS